VFSFLDGWLIFSIEVIGEHAVDVNDLTGRSGLEFAFESTLNHIERWQDLPPEVA